MLWHFIVDRIVNILTKVFEEYVEQINNCTGVFFKGKINCTNGGKDREKYNTGSEQHQDVMFSKNCHCKCARICVFNSLLESTDSS